MIYLVAVLMTGNLALAVEPLPRTLTASIQVKYDDNEVKSYSIASNAEKKVIPLSGFETGCAVSFRDDRSAFNITCLSKTDSKKFLITGSTVLCGKISTPASMSVLEALKRYGPDEAMKFRTVTIIGECQG
jgi:hypothetical protein